MPGTSSARRRRRWTPYVLMGTGLLLIAAVVGWQLNASLWMARYHRVGSALVNQERSRLAAGSSLVGSACNSKIAASGPQGLIEMPELGVVAPVEQGTTDAVLNVAVGHDQFSVWPGSNGTAVFNSHDVTYFVNIDKLHVGQTITYLAPCVTYTFKVTSQKVVAAGSPIYNTPGPSMALVTCWPTNALFFTNNRYVVMLSEVKSTAVGKANSITGSANGVKTSSAQEPTVPVPAALARQGLTLNSNYAPMGTLTEAGDPNARYVQSPAPLLTELAALVAYFGGLRALDQGHVDWWRQFAPGVAPPQQLIGHSVSYAASLDAIIESHGFTVTGVALRTRVHVDGGTYNMAIGTRINSKNVMTITSWKLS